MTIKEIKSKSNAELIYELSSLGASYKILKGNIKDAEKICKELEKRGIIEHYDLLFKLWLERYNR